MKGIKIEKNMVLSEVSKTNTGSIRAKVIKTLRDNRDSLYADRQFCDEYGVSNQAINQIMRTLVQQGKVQRVRPTCVDPYNDLPDGRRIFSHWIAD